MRRGQRSLPLTWSHAPCHDLVNESVRRTIPHQSPGDDSRPSATLQSAARFDLALESIAAVDYVVGQLSQTPSALHAPRRSTWNASSIAIPSGATKLRAAVASIREAQDRRERVLASTPGNGRGRCQLTVVRGRCSRRAEGVRLTLSWRRSLNRVELLGNLVNLYVGPVRDPESLYGSLKHKAHPVF